MGALDHAYARLARAEEHFTELESLNRSVCEAQREATLIEPQPACVIQPGESKSVLHVDNTRHSPVPERCSVLVGDVANNLRTALNYLVIQLAILDSGSKGRHQFPIEPTPESFKGNSSGKRGHLSGLTDRHIAMIEKFQPYNGCNWTRDLSVLSNFDKHEDLVFVAHDQLITIITTTESAADGKLSHLQMQVGIEPVLHISLGSGMPLIETLQGIKSQVSDLLDAFKPEFE